MTWSDSNPLNLVDSILTKCYRHGLFLTSNVFVWCESSFLKDSPDSGALVQSGGDRVDVDTGVKKITVSRIMCSLLEWHLFKGKGLVLPKQHESFGWHYWDVQIQLNSYFWHSQRQKQRKRGRRGSLSVDTDVCLSGCVHLFHLPLLGFYLQGQCVWRAVLSWME